MENGAALIAAVRDRDLHTAEELLEAGVAADAADTDGTTALAIASANADTQLVDLLCCHGADTDLRSPGGLTPLMLAADAGALSAVHSLLHHSSKLWLRDDLGRSALDIARSWLGVDPEAELRRRFGADGEETVVGRGPAPDEGLGTAEVIRISTPNGAAMIQTGHAAIATQLEDALNIRLSFAELMARGLTYEDPGHVGRWFPALYLQYRNDEETFALAAAAITSPDPQQRHFAAEVLLRYGIDNSDGPAPLADKTVAVLRRRAVEEQDPVVLERVVAGLGHHFDMRTLPEILLHAGHPVADVRAAVALALRQLVPADHVTGIETLLALCQDESAQVRREATSSLAMVEVDTPAIREAFARRLGDTDPDVVVEAARALGLRSDPRADKPLMRAFLSLPGGYDRELSRAYDVLRRWPMERFEEVRRSLA